MKKGWGMEVNIPGEEPQCYTRTSFPQEGTAKHLEGWRSDGQPTLRIICVPANGISGFQMLDENGECLHLVKEVNGICTFWSETKNSEGKDFSWNVWLQIYVPPPTGGTPTDLRRRL